ncbi:MAG: lipoyl synthase [Acidiferrobacteraceae bacterium]
MSSTQADAPTGVAGDRRNVSRMPIWIRQQLGRGTDYGRTAAAVHGHALHTVCEEARCPNRGECWSAGTATFMLLGDTCTRACGFCSVKTGRPGAVDADEPARVAAAVHSLGLRYVVLTSVNRDELADGGAGIFAQTLQQLRVQQPDIGVEFLTPDFRACQDEAVDAFADVLAKTSFTGADWPALVWGHNIETVPRLYRTARRGARYERSLGLLEKASAAAHVESKSAIMLGLGETEEEVHGVLRDLANVGVRRLAIGQYLRPGSGQLPVQAYVHPQQFAAYEAYARSLGFAWVRSGPLVRSSYHAEETQTRD